VARHDIPADGTKHIAGPNCPCGVKTRKDPGPPVRTVYAHIAQALPPAGDDGPEADCAHLVDGQQEHHQVPDDGAPHAPTSECGCGPHRVQSGGHAVYEHNQDGGACDDLER
jgi:hypothetical protein